MENKKTGLYFSSLVLITSISFIVYSCSLDEYDIINNEVKSDLNMETVQTLDGQSCRVLLIDSIGESDVFLDYIMSIRAFSKKFDIYYSTLNDEEKKQFSSSINNDDCVENIINELEVKDEIEQIVKTKEKLSNNTSYSTLSESEKSVLFNNYSNLLGNTIIKTRGEGGDTSHCEEARKRARDAAGAKLLSDQEDCNDYFEAWTTAHAACLLNAKLTHSDALSKADDAYKKCVKESKN